MLLVLLRLPRVLLLCFGFSVLSFRSWSYSVYVVAVLLFVRHIYGKGATPIFIIIYVDTMSPDQQAYEKCRNPFWLRPSRTLFTCLFIHLFSLFLLSLAFFSLVIALSTLLTALQCSISVWCCDHRACRISIIRGRIGTDTGCADVDGYKERFYVNTQPIRRSQLYLYKYIRVSMFW